MKTHWQRWVSFSVIALFIVTAVAAPLISPSEDPGNPSPYKRVGPSRQRLPQPPDETAILGTAPTQLDIFHTLVWGTREELKFGILIALLSAGIGTFIGVVSGYLGGAINRLTMRITDGFLTFPVIAAVVFIKLIFDIFTSFLNASEGAGQMDMAGQTAAASGSLGYEFMAVLLGWFDPFTLAILLFSWMPYARIINAMVINQKQAEYITSALAVGVKKNRIIFRHLLPNVVSPNIVLAARDVGGLVILRATFTYVGLTDGSPWAVLLVLGKNFVIGPGGSPGSYWWVYLPITVALLLFGFGWNLLGDEINDWLDPRTKKIPV